MEKKIYTIYKIVNKVNGKLYIGFTAKQPIEKRLAEHFGHAFAKKYKPDGSRIKKAIRKYGKHNFHIEAICCSLDRDYTLNVLEPHFIEIFDTIKNGYNVMRGGEGLSYHTEETKQKISEVKKRWYATHPNPNLGQKRPNAGPNISAAKKGKIPNRIWTDEQRKTASKRISGNKNYFHIHKNTWQKGVKEKPEVIERMSATWKITTPTGEELIIKNLSAYCREKDLSAGTLRMTSIGLRKTHKGYKCSMITPGNHHKQLNN